MFQYVYFDILLLFKQFLLLLWLFKQILLFKKIIECIFLN